MKENEIVGSCSRHGKKRNAENIFVGTAEGKGALERPRHRRKAIY
jgi:hypothetical protein